MVHKMASQVFTDKQDARGMLLALVIGFLAVAVIGITSAIF